MASAASSYYGGYGDFSIPPSKQDPVVTSTMQDAENIFLQATGQQNGSTAGSTTASTDSGYDSSSANGFETTPEQAQTAASGVMGHIQDAAGAIFSPQGLLMGGLLAGGAFLLSRGKGGGNFFSRLFNRNSSKALVVRRPTTSQIPVLRQETPMGNVAKSWGVNLPKYEGGKLSQAEFRQFNENYKKWILKNHPDRIPETSPERLKRQNDFDQMTQLKTSIDPNS